MQVAPEDVQEFRFTVVKGAKPGSKISIAGGQLRSVRIGRAMENEIVINDPMVSRSHVRVDIRADGCFISDAGSAAGVEKMGFRVGREPEPLQSGDEFRIGDTILKFEVVAKRGAKRIVPAAPAGVAAPAAPGGGSALQQALAKIGLRSRPVQVAVLVMLLVLFAIALWPEAPGLPPQASDQPLAMEYARTIGFNSADQTHLDKAIFTIPGDVEGLVVYFEAQSTSGIEILSAGKPVGRVEPSAEWKAYQALLIPRAIGGQRAALVFDDLGYSSADGDIDPAAAKPWSLRRMWLARAGKSATPGQLAGELRALGQIEKRVDDNLGNRYALLRGLRNDALAIMKLVGRPAMLNEIPDAANLKPLDVAAVLEAASTDLEKDDAVSALGQAVVALRQVESVLSREFRRQKNAYTLATKKGSGADRGAILANLTKMIPDPNDPRARQVKAEVRKMDFATNQAYQTTMQALGIGLSDR